MWRFHCGLSILSWFSGNEELFKERDQKDDEFLDRLKEFKIDSTDPQSEKVRKPNNEGWLTSSDVLFQSIHWPVETSKFNWWNLEFASLRAISARGDLGTGGKKKEGRLPDHKQICRKFIFHMLLGHPMQRVYSLKPLKLGVVKHILAFNGRYRHFFIP